MPNEREERLAELVKSALERPPESWAAFLNQECGPDAELRSEIESLLAQQEGSGGFLEEPALGFAAENLVRAGACAPGQIIGHYEIVSLIARGGMGEVYLAHDRQLQRKVALKLIRRGMDSADIVRRFRREGRLLAGLNHPNIAQLYGSGLTADGIPIFAMEYVAGQRLDEHCAELGLTTRQRLDLFRKICAAVTYAHQHLVIHRDIKPANIRVTAEGEPKLLDFGIAKLLDPEASLGGEQTLTLARVMTPEYASPEQVRGETVATTSDVYSLGVVLYRLLTGRSPYRTRMNRADEITRAITEQDPERPSTAAKAQEASDLSPSPHDSRSLRGDLDNIVLMALRKEPTRRYTSVGQFSEDIRRHLEGLPVIASKDTVGYRTSKFVARNRIAVAAAVLVGLAIIGGLMVSLWEAENARRQRDVAQRERLKAEKINTFLQDMLGAAAPEVKGVDVKVAEVLSEASRKARAEMAKQPDIMAEVLFTIGQTDVSLGLFSPAEVNLRAALETSLKANGALHPTTAKSMSWLGLALSYQDKVTEGETIARRAVELQRKLSPEGNGDLGVALYSWGMNLIQKGDPQAAEPVLKEAVELIRKHFGASHGYYLASLGLLGVAEERLGKLADAEMLYRRAIAVGRGVEPRFRIFLAQTSGYLGRLLTSKGAYSEAEDTLRQSENLYREIRGDSSSSIPLIQTNLGRVYFFKGDYAGAESEYRKALTLLPKVFPSEDSAIVNAKAMLGLTLTRLGKPTDGEPYLREALQSREKVLAADSPMIALTESGLGECLTAEKRYSEAEPLLLKGYAGARAKLGEQDAQTIEARHCLGTLYLQWKGPEAAKDFL